MTSIYLITLIFDYLVVSQYSLRKLKVNYFKRYNHFGKSFGSFVKSDTHIYLMTQKLNS